MSINEIDIQALSQAISPDNVTGSDLREDMSLTSPYLAIKDARNMARNIERKVATGESDADANEHWQTVHTLATSILNEHSKDIEVCTWLIEALIRQKGLPGLHAGFTLLNTLITNHWAQLYPLPDEDGLETKVAALTGLNGHDSEGSLIAPIRHLTLVPESADGPIALWQYQLALEADKITDKDKRQQRLDSGIQTLEDITKAATACGAEYYRQVTEDIDACLSSYQTLTQQLQEKCGQAAPPSSAIKSALESYKEHVNFIISDAAFTIVKPSAPVAAVTEPQTKQKTVIENQAIQSRQQALHQLEKVAAYFEATEPHSPIPFILQRAIRWGNLSLPELLKEMIQDDTALGGVLRLTGIEKVGETP